MCKKATESYNHIIFWCPVVYNIWTMVYKLLRINWVIAGIIRDELWAWDEIFTKNKFVKLISWIIFLGDVEKEEQ